MIMRATRHITWLPMARVPLNCIDGRRTGPSVGAPGGDVGELITALGAAESVLGRDLSTGEIRDAVIAEAEATGCLYLHTDRTALDRLLRALRIDPRLSTVASLEQVRRVPADLWPHVLSHLLAPAHVGCGHLRLMLEEPPAYGVRPGLVRDTLAAAFAMWRSAEHAVQLEVLEGVHEETSVVTVENDVKDGLVAAVSPRVGRSSVFVQHVRAREQRMKSRLLRIARRLSIVDVRALIYRASSGQRRAGAQTLRRLAMSLPRGVLSVAP